MAKDDTTFRRTQMPLSQKQYGKRAEKSVLNTHTTNSDTEHFQTSTGAESDVFLTAGPSPMKKHQLYTFLLQDDCFMQSPYVSLSDCLNSITWSSSGISDTQCLQHNCTDSQCKYVATDVTDLSVLCYQSFRKASSLTPGVD